MKKILESLLALFSRAILAKYHPDVVGVTGTIGKTTAKEAIARVLREHFVVRETSFNYNTEIGVPLAIIGIPLHPRKSFVGWLVVFLKALSLLLFKDRAYPNILVLEMGANKPGDIEYLTKLAPPRVGVLTAVTPVHMENFSSLEDLAHEKKAIFRNLIGDTTWAIVNRDEVPSWKEDASGSRLFAYGRSSGVDIRAKDVTQHLAFSGDPYAVHTTLSFIVQTREESCDFELTEYIGTHFVNAVLAAISVGRAFGIPVEVCRQALREFKSPRGRMRPIEGIKKTLLLDDTYNASPAAIKAALDVLRAFELERGARRFAVLGDMFELGNYADELHADVGVYAAEKNLDYLIVVGEKASLIAQAAKLSGLDEKRIFSFTDVVSASAFLKKTIRSGDLLLIKASQAMRFERIVKEFMARPEEAKNILVRQGSSWKN